jgi:transketolase
MAAEPMRDCFGKELVRHGKTNSKILVLDADVSKSTKTTYFGETFPERFFDVGIAEQNMVGIAAGAAACGYVPWVSTFSFLLTQRALEQVRSMVAYPNLNVKLAGGYAGFSDSFDGATHQSVFDIAVMRAMPNMQVIVPADNNELLQIMEQMMQDESPAYIRMSRAVSPDLPKVDVKLGKAIKRLDHGSDAIIFATGRMVYEAMLAAEELLQDSINTTVVEVHTIKPIDVETIVAAAEKTSLVITAEEHNIVGGLGSAVSEVLSQHCPRKIIPIGINDCFGESGPMEALFKKYGLTARDIYEKVKRT